MNCESKICVLENVQTVNSVCHFSPSEKNHSGLFFFASCCYFWLDN